MSTNIGFIGVGMMGLPMVQNLIRSGRKVIVCEAAQDRREIAARLAGLQIVGSPSEVVAHSDVVFTCLPNTDAIRQVYFGPDGICARGGSGKVACELSTTSPDLSNEVATALAKNGTKYLEATMIGPPASAESAQLYFIVAGEDAVVATVEPFLRIMGRAFRHVGTIGNATRAKLLHNALGMIHAVATCEVMALCFQVGVDPLAFVDIVRQAAKSRGVGYSTFFDMHAEDIARGREQGAGRLYIAAKDAHLAHDLAASVGFDAPLLAEADRTFAAGIAAGLGNLEYTAITRVIEQRMGRKIFPSSAP